MNTFAAFLEAESVSEEKKKGPPIIPKQPPDDKRPSPPRWRLS